MKLFALVVVALAISSSSGDDGGWSANPSVARDENGNTRASVGVAHSGPNHDVNAHVSKVIRGPARSRPTWGVSGTWRFKRDLFVNPHIDLSRHFKPGTPIISTPYTNRLQPGRHLPKRSVQPGAPNVPSGNQNGGWSANPSINRDGSGNTRATVGVGHTGPNHEVNGHVSKVVRGPGKSKPSFGVSGKWRFKRSLQPGAPNFPAPGGNQNGGWSANPNIGRDESGNTHTSIGIQHSGPQHDVHGEWSKVVRGPGRAKPTWNVGGTFKWKRSVDELEDEVASEDDELVESEDRIKRSLQPGAPNFPAPGGNQNGGWSANPNIGRDESGNTHTSIGIQHTGPQHDVHGEWSKVVRGPGRAKPTWNVGGTFKWKRSVDELEDEVASEDDELVESEDRIKRSLQPGAPNFPAPGGNQNGGWSANPNIGRDESGNTHTSIGIQHTGPQHDVHGEWSKVVRGPGRAKPTWNVGGRFKWKRSVDDLEDEVPSEDDELVESEDRIKRSLQPGAPNFPAPGGNQNGGWSANPNIGRDESGNTHTSIGIQHTGPQHDVHGEWSKVVRGPGRAKPTWNVGGTFKWKRSVDDLEDEFASEDDELVESEDRIKRSLQPGAPNFPAPGGNQNGGWSANPNIGRDESGNTHTSIGIQHTGPQHDVHGEWSKVVRGPGRAKPTWNVGGTFRWRRSLENTEPRTWGFSASNIKPFKLSAEDQHSHTSEDKLVHRLTLVKSTIPKVFKYFNLSPPNTTVTVNGRQL